MNQSLLLAAAVCGAGFGCAGTTSIEQAAGAEGIEGKIMTLSATQSVGWPEGKPWVNGTVEVISQDSREVTIAGKLIVLPRFDDTVSLELSGDVWLDTQMSIIVLHRDRAKGPDAPWWSVRCGDDWESTINGYYYFKDHTVVSVRTRTVSRETGSWDGPIVKTTPSFEACGITEREPEFAVFAAPSWNIYNMQGTYGYALQATCDAGDCGNATQTYDTQVIANNRAVVVANQLTTDITFVKMALSTPPWTVDVEALTSGRPLPHGESRAFFVEWPGELEVRAGNEGMGAPLVVLGGLDPEAAPFILDVGGRSTNPEAASITLRNRSTREVCAVKIAPTERDKEPSGSSWLSEREVIAAGASRLWDVDEGHWDLQAFDCAGRRMAAYRMIDTFTGAREVTAY